MKLNRSFERVGTKYCYIIALVGSGDTMPEYLRGHDCIAWSTLIIIFIHSMVYETWGCCLGKPGGVTLAWLLGYLRVRVVLRSSSRPCRFSRGAGYAGVLP